MRLPKIVRVGYRDYAVEKWDTNIASAAERLGECDRINCIIKVRADLSPMVMAEVLIHEVLHAAWDMGCLGSPPTGDEEKCVSVLGNQLTQIWRDNPSLVAFLSESLTGSASG